MYKCAYHARCAWQAQNTTIIILQRSSRVNNHSFVGIITGYYHSNNEFMIHLWRSVGVGVLVESMMSLSCILSYVHYLEVGLINMQILGMSSVIQMCCINLPDHRSIDTEVRVWTRQHTPKPKNIAALQCVYVHVISSSYLTGTEWCLAASASWWDPFKAFSLCIKIIDEWLSKNEKIHWPSISHYCMCANDDL